MRLPRFLPEGRLLAPHPSSFCQGAPDAAHYNRAAIVSPKMIMAIAAREKPAARACAAGFLVFSIAYAPSQNLLVLLISITSRRCVMMNS